VPERLLALAAAAGPAASASAAEPGDAAEGKYWVGQ